MNQPIMKYNPAFLSEQALIDTFSVRTTEFGLITNLLRENATSPINQHVLVVAPRGFGKTTLVLRVSAEIRRDEMLRQHWFPIVFGEESYEVTSPGELWLESLFHLARRTGSERWQQTYEELRREMDEDRLRERALAQLRDFATEENKRLVLVVENLNMMIGDQLSKEDAWVIRHALQNEAHLMLLGTATSRITVDAKYDEALYELFRVFELDPLDAAEIAQLWEQVGGKPLPQHVARPIEILTGGNPRLIRIIAAFAADRSFKDLMENLTHLVDEHTEYFKSHLDGLPVQERKVFVALADIWDPAQTRTVAEAARMPVNKTSAFLKRLEARGAIHVSHQKGRSKYYQVTERMYNLYHLMRRRGEASNRVRAVVRFMIHFYGPDELVDITTRLVDEACELESAERKDHLLAYELILRELNNRKLKKDIFYLTSNRIKELPGVQDSLSVLLDEIEVGNLLDMNLNFSDSGVESSSSNSFTVSVRDTSRDIELNYSERTLQRALEINPKNPLLHFLLSSRLVENNLRLEEALHHIKCALTIRDDISFFWAILSWIQYNLKNPSEALKAIEKAISISPEDLACNMFYAHLLTETGKVEAAINILEQVNEIAPHVSAGWYRKGEILEELERFEEALHSFKQACQTDPSDPSAIYRRIAILGAQNRTQDVIDELFYLIKNYELEPDGARSFAPFLFSLVLIGKEERVMKMLEDSPNAKTFEPLAVAIQLLHGDKVVVAKEVEEVAKDVVRRIELGRRQLEKAETEESSTAS